MFRPISLLHKITNETKCYRDDKGQFGVCKQSTPMDVGAAGALAPLSHPPTNHRSILDTGPEMYTINGLIIGVIATRVSTNITRSRKPC